MRLECMVYQKDSTSDTSDVDHAKIRFQSMQMSVEVRRCSQVSATDR